MVIKSLSTVKYPDLHVAIHVNKQTIEFPVSLKNADKSLEIIGSNQ